MPTSADAILIDDNPWVRSLWQEAGERAGKTIVTVATAAELYTALIEQAHEIPLFVDIELADGASGYALAQALFAQGFHHVFLATAHDRQEFHGLPFVAGVVGKEPPDWLISRRVKSKKLSADERRTLLAGMNEEQRAVADRRMHQYENALYGFDGSLWLDGVGVDFPEAVLDAWERAIYESASDEKMREMTDAAWLEARTP